MPSAERLASKPRSVSPSSPRPPQAPAKPVLPSRAKSPSLPPTTSRAPSMMPLPPMPTKAPGSRIVAPAKAPSMPILKPVQSPSLKTSPTSARVPSASIPVPSRAPSAPMVGQKKSIACLDGTKAMCSSGTQGCYDNSPMYCKATPKPSAPTPAKATMRSIQCSMDVLMCDASNDLCFDFSPQFCPSETDAIDSWTSPKPRPEAARALQPKLQPPPPSPCLQRMCGTLSTPADIQSCLCFGQFGADSPNACQGVGSEMSSSQASGLAARATCMSV